jgi:arginyl-tRNA synthetase
LPGNAVDRLAARLSELAGAPVELERPSDPEHGDYATNIALRTAPQRKQPPRELAAELAARAEELEEIERAAVAGPGFLNLWVTTAWLADALQEIGPDYGAGSASDQRQKIQVELISANPAGPLTVGSARNGAYGDSVARLLDYAGHDLAREYYFNDAGRQVDLFRASVEARRSGEELPEGGYQGECPAHARRDPPGGRRLSYRHRHVAAPG